MKMQGTRSPQAEREVRKDSPVRRARTCYDHLAGVAGVELFSELVRRGWSAEADGGDHPQVSLTSAGEVALEALGVNVSRAKTAKRRFGYGCLDWTEHRHHLGGALGAEVLLAMRADGLTRRNEKNRSVFMAASIENWLGA